MVVICCWFRVVCRLFFDDCCYKLFVVLCVLFVGCWLFEVCCYLVHGLFVVMCGVSVACLPLLVVVGCLFCCYVLCCVLSSLMRVVRCRCGSLLLVVWCVFFVV